jgi:exodeoxyribonuclease V alpha subunit
LRAQTLLELGDNKAMPVVIGVNDYSIRLFNGDDGIVMNDQVYFSEIDQVRSVPRSRLPSHLLGYAGSIHRSQGSEYDHVLIILPPPEAKMLTRELLYVAVSRAKSGVTIVGNSSAFLSAINQPEMTTSGLVEQLK